MNIHEIGIDDLTQRGPEALHLAAVGPHPPTTQREARAAQTRLRTTVLRAEVPNEPHPISAVAEMLAKEAFWPGRLALVGERKALDRVYRGLVARLAQQREPVFIQRVRRRVGPALLEGPTGSGKTALARQVHALLQEQRRGEIPFVQVNVAAVRSEDLESRMRGLVKGTYSGVGELVGWFERAHGGVLFLDEFQEATPEFQAQFLDLLSATSDEVTLARRGAGDDRKTWSVRTVLALNRPVDELLEEGRLRPDFVFRVRVRHRLPGLAEALARTDDDGRRTWLGKLAAAKAWAELVDDEDVRDDRPPLVELSAEAVGWLAAREWPGNYRELERLLADAAQQSRLSWWGETAAAVIDVETLEQVSAPHERSSRTEAGQEGSIPQLTAQAMAIALRRHSFHLGRAAEECAVLGMKSQPKFVAMLRELAEFLPSDVRSHPKVAARISVG